MTERSDGTGGDPPHSGNRAAMSRRRFLYLAGTAAAGLLAADCAPGTQTPATPEATPTPLTAVSPPSPTDTPLPEPTPVPGIPVSIAEATDYQPELIRNRVRDLLDGIGGLADVLRPGDRVAIKVNLTGGTAHAPLPGLSPEESYVTHPEVVRALGGFLRDAGAREILIVEAVYEWDSYRQWGYEEVAADLGATLLDLNSPEPYTDWASHALGEGGLVYPEFRWNHVLEDVDVFVSVAKMKNHWECGVTHSLKNLIGLVPTAFYRLEPQHNYRSALHGRPHETKTRLPRVIVDLNRARPIHVAIIDGVRTTQGGEGPWIPTISPVAPGVLVAGKDPVAADAVATAIMGHDPVSDYPSMPYIRCDNHLNLAREHGVGTNRLEEIRVAGPAIEDVVCRFETGWE